MEDIRLLPRFQADNCRPVGAGSTTTILARFSKICGKIFESYQLRVTRCKLLTSYEFDCCHIEPNAGCPRPGDKDCCPRCRGRVFQAERVLAAKGVYHRLGEKKNKRKREEKEKREE